MRPLPQQQTFDRIPPQNLEAEQAVLGSILVDREIMGTVGEILHGTDFHAPLHQAIYQALWALYERGEPLDKITLAEELTRRGLLENIGGISYINDLMDTVQSAGSAEYYAKIVSEKATLRSLIHAGTQITQHGFEGEDDVAAALDRSEQAVFEVGKRNQRGQFSTVSSLLLEAFNRIDERFSQKGDRTGITSGFNDIDQYTAGFQPGNLIILAARPAMGKTSMALTMAVAAAKEEKKPVAVFSLEMTSDEIVERLICSEARLDSSKIRRGAVERNEWEKMSHAMSTLNDLKILLDDQGGVSVTEVRSRLRRVHAAEGLGIAFIDYLQLLDPGDGGAKDTRNEQLSKICRMLKLTAKDLKIPIVALAQLNRGVESRPNKRPMLSDLRDSGSIEQEADMVAFLYRDAYYNPETAEPDMTEFIIAKHRNGPVGTVRLRFLKEHTLFVPYGDESYFSAP